MVVLPNEEYLELKNQQQQQEQPHPQSLVTPLEKKYDKVLHQFHQHSNIKDPIEQQYKQGEDLHELRRLREKMNTYYFKDIDHQRGSQLLSTLTSSSSLFDFNHVGEVIDKRNNKTISGSRIDDLINYAVNDSIDQHHIEPPHGWKDFVSILKAVHVPQHLLNSKTVHDMTSMNQSPAPSPSSTSSPPVPPSPPSSEQASPPPPKTKRKSNTPSHLHRPNTRLNTKRTGEVKDVVKVLVNKDSPKKSRTSFRKF